jgi:uncharacterized protein YndB with AHSA1/START domain
VDDTRHDAPKPMPELVVTAAVPAEPAEVFRYLTEPALLPRWIEGLRESRPQGDGVMRVGARSIEVVEARGKPVEMVSEVTAWEMDRSLSVRMTYPGDVGGADLTYALTPTGHGTDVRLGFTPRYRGVARLVVRFMKASTLRRLQGDLDRLVDVVRASTPDR